MQSILTLPLILLITWFFLGGTLFWSTRLIRVASPTLMRCMLVMLVYVIINVTYLLLAHLMKLQDAKEINLLVAIALSTALMSYMMDISLISGFFTFVVSGVFQLVMLLLITFLFSLQLSELYKVKDFNLLQDSPESSFPIKDLLHDYGSQLAEEN